PRGGRSALWWAANELVAALEGRSTLTVQQCITGVKRLLAEADLRTPRGEGEAAAMSANLARALAAMQAAWIEWRRGRGADAAMQWIENTLIGPGLIPGDDESDAQAFFDRAIAEIEEHRRGVEAEIIALAAPEPGGEGETLESRAYEVAHWIATEARVAESLGRSVAPIESEGARRIVALASARPTPADVRERVAKIVRDVMDDARRSERLNTFVQNSMWDYTDRILALLRTPRGEGEIAAVLDAVEAEADKWDDGIVPSFASRETVREIRRRLAVLRPEAQGEEEALAAEILAELRRA